MHMAPVEAKTNGNGFASKKAAKHFRARKWAPSFYNGKLFGVKLIMKELNCKKNRQQRLIVWDVATCRDDWHVQKEESMN